jgi:membrane protein YqaA with SNARE-associated domain
MTPERRTTLLRILGLLAVVAISVWVFSIRNQTDELVAWGYPGIFIISFLANATVILPAPGVAVVFAMGGTGIFNPLLVGLVAGVGSGLGELSGYLAGYSGQAVVERGGVYDKIHPYIEKYGPATIFVLAAIPNPFFDFGGMAAGVLKMPVRTFLLWCILGKIVKMLMFAYAGAYSIDWLLSFMK